jgi:hypothetical protein
VKRRVRNTSRRSTRTVTLRSLAISLGVAAVFLGMGTLISVLAPVHLLTLRRHGPQEVSAEVSQRVLLVIPVRGRTVTGVTGVSTRTYAPDPGPPEANPADVVRPELQAFLGLEVDGPRVDIPASPADVEAIERSVRNFLAGREPVLRVRIASNWKVGVVAVALVSLPGLLILVGVARDAASWRPRLR